MITPFRIWAISFALLILLAGSVWAFAERRALMMTVLAWNGPGAPPALLPARDEGPATRWWDDYFTVEQIAPQTWAIGEPRYAQQNYSYLIVGDDSALLFDAGPGIRNIRATAESLTDKPIIFLPSHFHYDHVGNEVTFEEVAVVDLPHIRDRARGDRLTLQNMEHLGMMEGFNPPSWQVDHWWAPGHRIDLGGRTLILLHTPGHTTDSISLFEPKRGLLFSGDYLYPGDLYAFLPNSSLGEYLATADSLLPVVSTETQILGAHRVRPPGPPRLDYEDLRDLQRGLVNIRDGKLDGESGYPNRFPINERLAILAEPRWGQRW